MNIFPKEQVKIILYEDYKNNTEEILKGIFQFLGVDTAFLPDLNKKYNVSVVPKHPVVNKMLKNVYLKTKDFFPERITNILKDKYKKTFFKK